MDKTQEYYNKLIDNLLKYADQYYNGDGSDISDAEFDTLYIEASQIELAHPEWMRADSPTKQVMGAPMVGLKEVYHNPPMLSLGKVMNYDELKTWLQSLGTADLYIECKHDGLACKLIYEQGKFVEGSTRGNGHVGNDVTQACMLIDSIPKVLSKPIDLEIRGEIFLTKSGMIEINNNKEKEYLKNHTAEEFDKNKDSLLFKTVRNAASGILRNLEPNKEELKHLVFSGYMDPNHKSYMTHSDAMKAARELGFATTDNFVHNTSVHISADNIDVSFAALENYFDAVNEQREEFDFDIDGMVLKINNYAEQDKMGSRKNTPYWAIAYKFPQEEKVSILRKVEWLLGDKGNITPRATIDTVNILGADVSAATLHNIKEIERLDIKIGDHVVVTRRGDVIPKIVAVHYNLRMGNEKDIVIPTVCPVCGAPVTRTKTMIRCNNESCTGRYLGKISNFINALGIKNFGNVVVAQLIDAGKLKYITDIFYLCENDIACLDRQGQKSASNIIKAIEKAKSAPLKNYIAGLGIPSIGTQAGKVLAQKYNTFENFEKATFSELIELEDFGDVTANYIITWINDNRDILHTLINLRVGLPQPSIKPKSGKLNNKTFACTGALSIPRKKVQEIVEQYGGIFYSIKKGLDYLIVGDNAVPAKISKAEKYGAKIIGEEDIMKMIS